MPDQNFEGLRQKLELPYPSQVQNWNVHGVLNFWATPSKFCKNTQLLMLKWHYYHVWRFSLWRGFTKKSKACGSTFIPYMAQQHAQLSSMLKVLEVALLGRIFCHIPTSECKKNCQVCKPSVQSKQVCKSSL